MSEIYPYLTYIALLLKNIVQYYNVEMHPTYLLILELMDIWLFLFFFFYCINILVHLLFGGYVCSFLLSVCPGLG